MIKRLNHFTVLTDDLERSLDFYVNLLGLTPGKRPDFNFPGAWLYVGPDPVLHLVAGRNVPPQRAGVIDHVAFSAIGLSTIKAALQEQRKWGGKLGQAIVDLRMAAEEQIVTSLSRKLGYEENGRGLLEVDEQPFQRYWEIHARGPLEGASRGWRCVSLSR